MLVILIPAVSIRVYLNLLIILQLRSNTSLCIHVTILVVLLYFMFNHTMAHHYRSCRSHVKDTDIFTLINTLETLFLFQFLNRISFIQLLSKKIIENFLPNMPLVWLSLSKTSGKLGVPLDGLNLTAIILLNIFTEYFCGSWLVCRRKNKLFRFQFIL